MSGKTIETAKQWIIKGDHDLGTAKITYLHIPEYLVVEFLDGNVDGLEGITYSRYYASSKNGVN